MNRFRAIFHVLFHEKLFTPRGFLVRAGILLLCFLIAHFAGLREYASIISGTSPTGEKVDWLTAALGLGYIMLYFAVVLIVPILTLAALFFLAMKLRSRRGFSQ